VRRGGTGAEAAAHPRQLRDVVDDEEEDKWRHWGASHSPGDGPPPDLSRMDSPALQAELLRSRPCRRGFSEARPVALPCRPGPVPPLLPC